MNNDISYQGNPQTRGTAPFQVFEVDGEIPPPGTKATPRPADRPRDVPLSDPTLSPFQLFEDEGSSGTEASTATPRPRSTGSPG
jgi:hypothetical protein